jgi:tRNA modification GTPase
VATLSVVGDYGRLVGTEPPLFRAANGRPLTEQPTGRLVFGSWGDDPPEDVVVCRVDDQTLEINCHGGDAAARRILDHLTHAGCRIVPWFELLKRADGLLTAELAQALSQATTARTAAILLDQSSGLLRNELDQLIQAAEALAAPAASSADSPHERRATLYRHALRERLEALLARADFGLHLTRPWSVVLAGRPNVGKSSLINALVGFTRSIVFDQPGTTRDVVTAETAFDGWPVRLSDTAGLRAEADDLESAGIQRARAQLAQADCRVLLIDTSEPPTDFDRDLLSAWPDALVVAHKADLPDVWGDAVPECALRVSSVTREGVNDLIAAIVRRLVPDVPPPGTPVPVSERQVQLLRSASEALDRGVADACRATLQSLQLK